MERKEIIIRDFSEAELANMISDKGEKGKWRIIDWQSSTDAGKLLFA